MLMRSFDEQPSNSDMLKKDAAKKFEPFLFALGRSWGIGYTFDKENLAVCFNLYPLLLPISLFKIGCPLAGPEGGEN